MNTSNINEKIITLKEFNDYLSKVINEPYNHDITQLDSLYKLIKMYYEENSVSEPTYLDNGQFSDRQPYTEEREDPITNTDYITDDETTDDIQTCFDDADISDAENADISDDENVNVNTDETADETDENADETDDADEYDDCGLWSYGNTNLKNDDTSSCASSDNEDYYWKLYSSQQINKQKINNDDELLKSNERIEHFMNNDSNTDELLLYKKNNTFVERTSHYIESINTY